MSDATAGSMELPPQQGQYASAPKVAPDQVRQATTDSLRALMLIRNYRVRGHLHANLDPLGLVEKISHADLDPASYGFTKHDLDRPVFINYVLGLETASLDKGTDAEDSVVDSLGNGAEYCPAFHLCML